ncbi:hypothetical protein Tco_1388052 [Tanacetum coccineum]
MLFLFIAKICCKSLLNCISNQLLRLCLSSLIDSFKQQEEKIQAWGTDGKRKSEIERKRIKVTTGQSQTGDSSKTMVHGAADAAWGATHRVMGLA